MSALDREHFARMMIGLCRDVILEEWSLSKGDSSKTDVEHRAVSAFVRDVVRRIDDLDPLRTEEEAPAERV